MAAKVTMNEDKSVRWRDGVFQARFWSLFDSIMKQGENSFGAEGWQLQERITLNESLQVSQYAIGFSFLCLRTLWL